MSVGGYDLTKSTVTITADLIGISVPLNGAFKSIEFDPGSKRAAVKGARRRPLYIAIGASDPKLKIGFSIASVYKDAWQKAGGQAIGAGSCTISMSLLDIASGSFEPWEFLGIILPEPGIKLGDDGATYDAEFIPTDVWVDGASIYAGDAS